MGLKNKFVVGLPADKRGICAVVTTFQPSADLVANIKLIVGQVARVIIVDDSGTAEGWQRLRLWFRDMRTVEILSQPYNLGQATALNCGIAAAQSRGYQWILTLDDDTSVESDLVGNLIRSWNTLSGDGGKPVAVIGASHRDGSTGCIEAHAENDRWFLEKRGIITAGSLFPVAVYQEIGPFRDEFFIDSVDYDFCLRARAAGYRVVKLSRVGMTHSIGSRTRHHLGCLTVETTNHTPVRRYYMYRNSLVLALEYLFRDPLFSFAVVFFNFKTLVLVLVFEEYRARKVGMMWRGTIDALAHRMGKLQSGT